MIQDFKNGLNLTEKFGASISTIEVAYELQSGEYTLAARRDKALQDRFFDEVSEVLLELIPNLSSFNKWLDVGIGEGTGFAALLERLPFEGHLFGIDISWSRLSWAKSNLANSKIEFLLAVANAENIPIADFSIPIVSTFHALEPNGGRELAILEELARVASKYLVFVEPDFEKADPIQQLRMSKLGYVKNLREHFQRLDFELICDRKLVNNLHVEEGYAVNSASIFILRRKVEVDVINEGFSLRSPISFENLRKITNGYITETGFFYPELEEVPFLREQDTLLALSHENFLD